MSPATPAAAAPAGAGDTPSTRPENPTTPTFSPPSVSVIFVLGGPGSGKGTQCAKMVKEYGFTHLSAGDLLRAEQDRPDSEFGELIKEYIREGTIVPMEVTVQLLENAMTEVLERNKDDDDRKEKKKKKKEGRFLIDGFPRKMDQAIHFEKSVCPSEFILFLDCPETIMESRLLHRGKTSGRADDNADSIRKRFRTFVETSMPVVRYFEEELGKVERVSAVESPDAVYDKVRECLGRRGFSI